MRLAIEQTWDGKLLPVSERAELRLVLTAAALLVHVDAPFHSDPAPSAAPGSTPALWNHEVVELFVLGADDHYLEVELGPSGHHLLLQLEGERQLVASGLPCRLSTHASASHGRWSATASIARALLPRGPWRVNAYAIHGSEAARRYCVHTPLGTAVPDFHAICGFVTEFPARVEA